MIFEPGKKHLFLDISSTNTDTPAPRCTSVLKPTEYKSFDFYVNHFRTSDFYLFISEISATKVELLYATNTSHRKQETFLYEYPLHWVLFLTKKNKNAALRWYTPQALSPF
jgi:hypothetical protein